MAESHSNTTDQLHEYTGEFVQRLPRFAYKKRGGKWRTVHKGLGDRLVEGHLDGKFDVASLGGWYPRFGLIDFDEWSITEVNRVRDAFGLDRDNSLLCTSESPDSYHLIFRPRWNGRPATIRGLHLAMSEACKATGVELFPQATHGVRLPFGRQQMLFEEDVWMVGPWADRLYWFQKLDEYDLGEMPKTQQELPLGHGEIDERPLDADASSLKAQGRLLWEYGLQEYNRRHYSQFAVIYYLWRENVPLEMCEEAVNRWIKRKHNGLSEEANRGRWRTIRQEIKRQVHHIYTKYQLPDTPNNLEFGTVTRLDVPDLFHIADGSLPRARFLHGLVRYLYPRRHRATVNVHSDRLIAWSSYETYLKRLEELQGAGLLERGTSYEIGVRSKQIKLRWPWREPRLIVTEDGRAPRTLEETCKAVYEDPEELRAVLKLTGMQQKQRQRFLKTVYEPNGGGRKQKTYNNSPD